MKTVAKLIVLSVFVSSWAIVAPPDSRADCADGMVELNCGGLPECLPAGSVCCGATPCSAELVCLRCDGNAICRAPGSTCCGNVACPPGQECQTCGTQTMCRPRGEGCPIGDLD